MKKVSIIVLICNVSNYVRQCLTSLMNQTYSNIEIICELFNVDYVTLVFNVFLSLTVDSDQ